MLSYGPCKNEIRGSEQVRTEGNVTTEAEVRERTSLRCYSVAFEDGERDHEPRHAVSRGLKKAKKTILP